MITFFDSEKQKTDPPSILKFSETEMRISVGMGKFADQVPVISKPAEWPTPLL
jgi:hypothetical protein